MKHNSLNAEGVLRTQPRAGERACPGSSAAIFFSTLKGVPEAFALEKSQVAAQLAKRAAARITPDNFLAAICTPNYGYALSAIGRTQTTMDQARIVCGLERYRLANGQYPTNLAALLPRFLDSIPRDVITGKPMNYRRKDEQTFLLYSIGWNETDDGGITVRKKDGKEDSEAGDWVWHEDNN